MVVCPLAQETWRSLKGYKKCSPCRSRLQSRHLWKVLKATHLPVNLWVMCIYQFHPTNISLCNVPIIGDVLQQTKSTIYSYIYYYVLENLEELHIEPKQYWQLRWVLNTLVFGFGCPAGKDVVRKRLTSPWPENTFSSYLCISSSHSHQLCRDFSHGPFFRRWLGSSKHAKCWNILSAIRDQKHGKTCW